MWLLWLVEATIPVVESLGHITMLCQSCFFFSNREKGKISISVSGFPNSKNEILYDVVNLVVPAPLPMESTVKLRSARAVGPVVLTGRRAQIPG